MITHTYTISAYNLTPLTTALGGDFMARVGLAESEWDGVSVHDQPRPLHDVASPSRSTSRRRGPS